MVLIGAEPARLPSGCCVKTPGVGVGGGVGGLHCRAVKRVCTSVEAALGFLVCELVPTLPNVCCSLSPVKLKLFQMCLLLLRWCSMKAVLLDRPREGFFTHLIISFDGILILVMLWLAPVSWRRWLLYQQALLSFTELL